VEAAGHRQKVRLAGIDAPEKSQPWGEASTLELRRQLAGRAVIVEWHKKDRWGRLIGVVHLNDNDMNLHQIDRGLAWHFKRYQNEQSPSDRQTYSAAESQARDAGHRLRPFLAPAD
jgi:endonuclease YncB( thermonuclease family)